MSLAYLNGVLNGLINPLFYALINISCTSFRRQVWSILCNFFHLILIHLVAVLVLYSSQFWRWRRKSNNCAQWWTERMAEVKLSISKTLKLFRNYSQQISSSSTANSSSTIKCYHARALLDEKIRMLGVTRTIFNVLCEKSEILQLSQIEEPH